VKIMEYMAQGKPVVAFALDENRVTAGDAALYATPNNERDLARQILRLMDNPDLRAALGDAGRNRLAQGLTWDHQQRHLLSAYQSLVPTKPAVPAVASVSPRDSLIGHYKNDVCATD